MRKTVAILGALWLFLASPLTSAVGLGPLQVQSSLGQPLSAAIPLRPEPLPPAVFTVRLASPEQYRTHGFEYSAELDSIRVRVDPAGDSPRLRLESRRPLSNPAMELVLELQWPGGRLRRSYALLLDLPAQRRERPAAAGAAGEWLAVHAGDSLGAIAERLAPTAGVGTQRMMAALFAANPQAFAGGNMNNLRAGSRLRIPGADAMVAVSESQARALVAAQYAVGDNGGPVRSTAMDRPTMAPATQDASLQLLTPELPEAAEPARLGSELQQRLAEVRRARAAIQEQNRRLRARLIELERNVAFMAGAVLSAPAPDAVGTGQAREPAPTAVPAAAGPVTQAPPASAADADGIATVRSSLRPTSHQLGIDRSWWHALFAGGLALLAIGVALYLWRILGEDDL